MLDRLPSLKLKIGLVVVVAIIVTLGTLVGAALLDVRMRWGALAAIGLSLATVQVVARGLTAPLRAMAGAAEAMARGEHGQRIAETRAQDEVGQLARAFNRMAAELEQTDRVRRDLVADAAHELRTPVSALRAALENAVDGVGEVDLPDLLAQTERLSRLADQLLDLSRLEAGAEVVHRREFDAQELVAGLGVALDAPAGLRGYGDPDRLRQVVANLVENARRHGGGEDPVVRARGGAALRVEVEDHGPGLPPGAEERVFERFARLDGSRSVAGSGLGLAIARSIVELHGGTIRAERSEPTGCRMVVTLP